VGSMRRLIPSTTDGKPGLLVNPDWKPGTPGTFAVIIGVSEYLYLQGGAHYVPTDETYGLGQLHVSALTACAFLNWFDLAYDAPDAPPAQCWVRLSPSEAEREALGETLEAAAQDAVTVLGAAPATMDSCEEAIGSWFGAMAELSGDAAAKSRSLFFFSGHGLEVAYESQVLLPTDYLRRPGRSVNAAISTANLSKGLQFSPVTNHLLFVDACRNDNAQLRQFVLTGRNILNEKGAAAANADALTGILYASAAGTQTWQPREINDGLSVFGGALVRGLEGGEGIERRGCDGQHCQIHFDPLKEFVTKGMGDVLSAFNSQEKARVRQGGTPPNGGITRVREGSVAPAEEAPPPTQAQQLAERYDVVHADLQMNAGGDYPSAHDIFGSERMTDIWMSSVQAYDLANGIELPREDIVIREVRRSSDTTAFRIAVALPSSEHGHWLRFSDPRGHHFATSLAGTPRHAEKPVYELTIDFEMDEHTIGSSSRWVSTFEARLSWLSQDPLGPIAAAWEANESQNAAIAVQKLDVGNLLTTVMEKEEAPLSATVAATLLLRARRLDMLPPQWLDNLSDWFPMNSDANVLRGERERLKPAMEVQTSVIVSHLAQLYPRGIPRIADLLPLAWRQLGELEAGPPVPPGRVDLAERLHRAMSFHRPGGLFAVYASLTDPLDVDLVMPG
jgi:hypothetical protein